MLTLLVGLITASRFAASCAKQELLTVVADDVGSVSVFVDGELWLRSSTPPWLSGDSGVHKLSLASSDHGNGSSAGLGFYEAQTWEWTGGGSVCPSNNDVTMRTELRRYHALPNATVFMQQFPCGVASIMAPSGSSLASSWPSFEEVKVQSLRWATFSGYFAQQVDRGIGLNSCHAGRQGGSPLMLYDEETMRTVITSQLTRMKTGEIDCSGALAFGVKSSLDSIPADFSASWVLHAGIGVARTMEGWGDVLLSAGGKRRVGVYEDDIVGSLGYWTDNGAYYHYPVTGPTLQAGGYQQEILKAHQANVAQQLPFRHWQLDSWWYLKGAGGNGSSRGSGAIGPVLGVYEWVADPFVFPDGGVPAIQTTVELPFVLHNRWFSPENVYRSRGIPSSGWTGGKHAMLPLDHHFFWDYFFKQQKGYGLKVYEQDFLYTQYDLVPAMSSNATFADEWLLAMSDAATRHDLTIQYCMPYPRDYLASTLHRAVRTIRASDDYAPNNANWRIARQSLLAHAVGLLPYKDTFLSGDVKEVGAANPGPELTPELHTLVSTLSGAMVGPGDGPGMANRTRLLQTCREDGVLLKADRPAVPVDASWTSRDPGGELSWSLSVSSDARAQRYVLAADLRHSFNLTLSDVELPATGDFIAREWYSGELRRFDAARPLLLRALSPSIIGLDVESDSPSSAQSPVSFQYWTISEALHGWVLLGEVAKYITMSARRIRSVQAATNGSLHVGVVGSIGERVTLCGLPYSEGSLTEDTGSICAGTVIGNHGTATVTLSPQHPADRDHVLFI
eukprot:TRINITY_DN76385_c0_g1_i1.p1 TRINITY_DN76385_c0_g1~~TRINITY_DN76385_c0_g1_i1.p1  ORF type:complete len:790 (-),score=106.47 TRINITY_DN76385_c0_g1_i1:72-2441(-)